MAQVDELPVAQVDADGRPWSSRIVSRMLGLPPRWMGVAAAVLALGVSGLFGGLDPVEVEPDIATVEVGTAHHGQPWNVTVTGAGFTSELPPLKLQEPGNRWLIVAAVVEVTSDESRFDLYDVLRLRNAPDLVGRPDLLGVRPDRIMLTRDAADASRLHPDLPEKLYFVWEQAGSAEPPPELEIEIIGKTLRAESLGNHLEWLDPEPRALVRAQVKDLDA
ncbi:MAG: hypothetical protein FWJ93_12630 [Micromonosporaceae bacterium]